MRAKPLPRMTADEFIEWAMGLPDGERYELVGGEVVAMSPERISHARTKGQAYRALGDALRRVGLPCEALPDGVSVRVDAETVYEPDALVRCGESLPEDAVEIGDPLIVVEVVSPSSGGRDKGAKLEDYFRLPSVRHYLILDIKRRSAIHHRRDAEGLIQSRVVRTGTLGLSPPGIEVTLDDLFA